MARAATAAKSREPAADKPRIIKGRPWIWMQSLTDKDRWMLDHIPAGEAHAPKIVKSSKNSDGTYNYGVTRNGKAIGAPKDLEKAKRMAESGQPDQQALQDMAKVREYEEKTPRDAAAFKKLSAYAQSVIANERPWLMPGRRALEEKGVKVKANVIRDDLKSKAEKKAEAMALPMDEKIKVVNKKNPKKAGSDAWGRWEVLFAADGKTVGEYVKMIGSNPTTLRNAVAKGFVKVNGMGGK